MPNSPKTFRPYKWPARKRKDDRPSAAARGYDFDWLRASSAYKAAHPYCEDCLEIGLQIPVAEVDHIRPFRGLDDPLRLDPTNFRSRCKSHHVTKTHKDKQRGLTRLWDKR